MWDYSSHGNYHALQIGANRRYDRGVMFSVFYVRSRVSTLEHNNDFAQGNPPACQCGPPNFTPEQVEALDWSYAPYNRPHNFVTNFVYQTPAVASGALGALTNDWRDLGHLSLVDRRPVSHQLLDPRYYRHEPHRKQRRAQRPHRRQRRPWSRIEHRPVPTIGNPTAFAPPRPGSTGTESDRFFLHGPAINNLDLSFSKRVRVKRGPGGRDPLRPVQRAESHAVDGRQQHGQL